MTIEEGEAEAARMTIRAAFQTDPLPHCLPALAGETTVLFLPVGFPRRISAIDYAANIPQCAAVPPEIWLEFLKRATAAKEMWKPLTGPIVEIHAPYAATRTIAAAIGEPWLKVGCRHGWVKSAAELENTILDDFTERALTGERRGRIVPWSALTANKPAWYECAISVAAHVPELAMHEGDLIELCHAAEPAQGQLVIAWFDGTGPVVGRISGGKLLPVNPSAAEQALSVAAWVIPAPALHLHT